MPGDHGARVAERARDHIGPVVIASRAGHRDGCPCNLTGHPVPVPVIAPTSADEWERSVSA